jgi:disulfide oxidoreductase YuzD
MYRDSKFANITEIERVNLYNEIWTEPVQTVAKRYDMSDTALRKHCKRLDIPLPYRGYWAKFESGQKVEKTKLPKVTKEVSKYVREYLIKYRDDLDDMSDEELLSYNELNLLTDETILYIKEQCNKIIVSGQLRNACKEILDHIEEMERRKKRDRELRSAVKGTRYYYNIENKYGDNKSVLPIDVSKQNVNRAYRIVDTLIKALPYFEANIQVGDNYRVWNEPIKNKASINILRSHFEISIYEKNDDLVMDIDSNMKYCDQKDNNLENQLGQILLDIMIEGNKRYAKWLVESRIEHRKWEEQLRVWEEEKRQEKLKKLRGDRLEEMEQLLVSAADWEKAARLRKFLNAIELKMEDIKNTDRQEKLKEWITEQRKKVDWFDPLIYVEDEQLGEGPYLFNDIFIKKIEDGD